MDTQNHALHGVGHDGEPWCRTVVAAEAGRIIGAASLRASSIHPARLWTYVEVAPDARRRGVGTALLGAARTAVTGPSVPAPESGDTARARALRTKIWADDVVAVGFARAHGCVPLMRCRERRLEPFAVTIADVAVPAGFRVEAGPAPTDLVDALVRLYRWGHRWDPVADPAPPSLHAALAADVLAGSGVLARTARGEAIGVGVLHDDGETLGISHVGVWAPVAEAMPLTRAMAARLLAVAARDGRPVSCEGDESYPHLLGVVDGLACELGRELLIVADG